MAQEDLTAAVAGQLELIKNLLLSSLGYLGTVKVGALSVGVTLELTELLLIMEPLIGEHLTTVHTAHGNDHPSLLWLTDSACGFQLWAPVHDPLRSRPTPFTRAPSFLCADQMSSTLFARGVNGQVGNARRMERMLRDVADTKAAMELVKDVPLQIYELKSTLSKLERAVACVEASVSSLEARVKALEPTATESDSS